MNTTRLLEKLPTFNGNVEFLQRKQRVSDIVREMVNAHNEFAPHYDKISEEFAGRDLLRRLFTFVEKKFPYQEEPEKLQTVRSPGANLILAPVYGSDCKHFAGWIAGIIDSLNRKGLTNINWAYRFASYDRRNKTPEHVFIVVFNKDGSETWLDPAPIQDTLTKKFYKRSFDDRMLEPIYYKDVKPNSMSLAKISKIGTAYTANKNSGSCIGCGNGKIGATLPAGYTYTIPTTSPTTLKEAAASIPGAGAVVDAATKIIKLLPDGGLKNFLNSFINDPAKALIQLITGKTYRSGEYALGEIYMRNILGMPEIQEKGQVPDGIVPQAWAFFSSSLGVRIGSGDHLNALARSTAEYYNWLGTAASDVKPDQAERARRILLRLGYPANQLDYRRNQAWALGEFLAEPLIYPLHNAAPGEKFNLIHPLLNVQFRDGYPVTATSGFGSPVGSGAGIDQPAGDTTQKESGLSKIAPWLIGGAIATGLGYMLYDSYQEHTKQKRKKASA